LESEYTARNDVLAGLYGCHWRIRAVQSGTVRRTGSRYVQHSLDRSARSAALEELLQRVRAEYLEMPSLRLTIWEAQRLFGLTPSVCVTILETLLKQNFLSRTTDGLFVQAANH